MSYWGSWCSYAGDDDGGVDEGGGDDGGGVDEDEREDVCCLPRVYSFEDLEESRVDRSTSSPDSTGSHKSNQSRPKTIFVIVLFFLEASADMRRYIWLLIPPPPLLSGYLTIIGDTRHSHPSGESFDFTQTWKFNFNPVHKLRHSQRKVEWRVNFLAIFWTLLTPPIANCGIATVVPLPLAKCQMSSQDNYLYIPPDLFFSFFLLDLLKICKTLRSILCL